ncbi:MAG TPA: P-loop NTPase [Candidatus Limnocylindrales bacterium]
MKSVVVASGKGGTGKTTLSAVFAQLASQQMAVVVADGDVETSNLPLALGVTRCLVHRLPRRRSGGHRCPGLHRMRVLRAGVPIRSDRRRRFGGLRGRSLRL